MMRTLDLFSGIGGFSLGLERTGGFKTVAFCEIDPYCRAVLRKHWPDVPIYDDVRTLTANTLRRDGVAVDVICGGFPCQDISFAGRGEGLDGERSGLWFEYARLIGEIRPRYVLVENVAALLGRGLDRVLADLAALGFDAEWHCIPASSVGAPHRRDRVWIIAHACRAERRAIDRALRRVAGQITLPQGEEGPVGSSAVSATASDADSIDRRRRAGRHDGSEVDHGSVPSADAETLLRPSFFWQQSERTLRGYWPQTWQERLEELRGVDDGVSGRMDGLAALGNAVVPQIPEIIGRAILAAEEHKTLAGTFDLFGGAEPEVAA